MHGLRCTPALLGWTRVLDEWVVGLTRYGTTDACWRRFDTTVQTLAEAATRVRSFAGRDAVEPTVATSEGTMAFELQGIAYGVAVTQQMPADPNELKSRGVDWLAEAARASKEAFPATLTRVGAVFVTPRLGPGQPADRATIADEFIQQSRIPGSDGCGFSFPRVDEIARYHYGNDEFPGAMLLIQAAT